MNAKDAARAAYRLRHLDNERLLSLMAGWDAGYDTALEHAAVSAPLKREQILAKVYRTAAEFARRNPSTTIEDLAVSLDEAASELDPEPSGSDT